MVWSCCMCNIALGGGSRHQYMHSAIIIKGVAQNIPNPEQIVKTSYYAMKVQKYLVLAITVSTLVLLWYSKIELDGFSASAGGEKQVALENEDSNQQLPTTESKQEIVLSKQSQQENKSSCCSIASKYQLEALCVTRDSGSVHKHCNCTDYMLCKLVMVTALSSNHFKESTDYFGSVYAKLPNAMIIVYDLGLTNDQVNTIQSYCNVKEVRKLNFDKYPSHTKRLFVYAWKPFIVNEMSREYEVFLYCDASCRIKDNFVDFLPKLLKFPVLPGLWLPGSVILTTHDGMLNYLQPKMNRSQLTQLRSFGATALLIWVTDYLKDKVLSHWVDCAMHVECISPKGSKLLPCNFRLPSPKYVGCHRYDQSALNVILMRELGANMSTVFSDEDGVPAKDLVDIERYSTAHYNNHQCNIKYY